MLFCLNMVRLTATIIALILGITSCMQSENSGFGYELLASHLESLDSRLTQLSVNVKIHEQRLEAAQKQLNQNLKRQEQNMIQLIDRIQKNISNIFERQEENIIQLMKGMQKTVSMISDQTRQILEFNVQPKHAAQTPKVIPAKGSEMTDCSNTNTKIPGTCLMDIGDEKAVSVYLDLNFGSGFFLFILQRFDGSEDFNRDWDDYRNGFGTAGKEYWLGLERLHKLTKNTTYELLVELEDFNGNYKYALYDSFSIGPEADDYSLENLGAYSGTAGDSFRYHKRAKFSTRDKGSWEHCAHEFTGGWWYGAHEKCYEVHPTGTWDRNGGWRSIVWKSFGSPENLTLKVAKMMIRQVNK